jgi:S-layer protein
VTVTTTGNFTDGGIANQTLGAITVRGGTSNTITTATGITAAETTAALTDTSNSTLILPAVTVTGLATTTDATVTQPNAVAVVQGGAATAAVTETGVVTFSAVTDGDTIIIAGITVTAIGSHTAAAVAASFASLAVGATGNEQAGLTVAGTLAAWTTGAVVGNTVTFSSSTAGPVGDLSTAGTGTSSVVPVQGVAAVAAITGKIGVTEGAITVNDANAASTTAAGTITTVSVNEFGGGATINSGALTSLTIDGTGSTVNAGTSGALTTATATTMALNLAGTTSTGAVTLDSDITTVNISSATAANTLQTLTASGATAVNISGSQNLVLTNNAFAATAAITSTSTGNVTLGSAVAVGQTYTGGSGVDTLTTTTASTKATTLGGGNDVITATGVFGTGGSLDGGDGTDTIVMTAAQAATATASTTFAGKVSNLETLSIGATGAATAINMANADGMNTLTSAGFGHALTITGAAAGFTFNQTVLGSVASSIALTTATGTADTVNLGYSGTDGFTNSAAITIAGVEILNITTDDTNNVSAATAPTVPFVAPITATSATTVTVSGDAGFNATGLTSTKLTSFDASGVTATGAGGAVTLTTGVLTGSATLTGGAGTNVLNASAVTSTTKVMTITGGAGADTLTGGAGPDVITGGNGVNTLVGGAGNDTITGGTGVDTITGSAGADIINAGAGNDTITGGVGANAIDGEAGTDTYVTNSAQVAGNIEGAGTGTSVGVIINLGATAVTNSTVLANTASENLAQNLTSVAAGSIAYLFADSLVTDSSVVSTISNVENVTLSGNGINYVVGSATANTITIGTGADYIDAGAGNDTIVATSGANITTLDVLLGGAGTDALHITNVAGANAVVDDQVGIESIVLKDGVAAADSTITITYSVANTAALTIDARELEPGAGAASEDFTLVATTNVGGVLTVLAGGGTNSITTGSGADIITGGYGVDTIVSAGGADTITPGFGADIITSGAGADSIILTQDVAAIDIIITTTGAAYTAALADSITGAVVTIGGTNVDIDLSDVELTAAITDLVLAGDAATSVSATNTGVAANVTAAYDMAGAATAIWLNVSGTYAASTDVETALEIGGARALTTNGVFAAADAFLITYSDGTDAFLAHVSTTAGAGNDSTFAAYDLVVTNMLKFVGLTDVTTVHADLFDIVA